MNDDSRSSGFPSKPSEVASNSAMALKDALEAYVDEVTAVLIVDFIADVRAS